MIFFGVVCGLFVVGSHGYGDWKSEVVFGKTIPDCVGMSVSSAGLAAETWDGLNNRPWFRPNGSKIWIDMLPTFAHDATILGMDSASQVGVADTLPTIWHSSRASARRLNWGGYRGGEALAVCGNRVGGNLEPYGTGRNAVVWDLAAGTRVDLKPRTSSYSGVLAITDETEVGFASGSSYGACLWHGSAASIVVLTPAGATEGAAYGATEDYQSGYAKFSGIDHAVLWRGSRTDYTDLHPLFANTSKSYGASGDSQVGYAEINHIEHAAYWRKTMESFVDLHEVLPPFYTRSIARSVYEDDDTITVIGWADRWGGRDAVVWTCRK